MLTVEGSVNSRDARGGTAPIQVAKQLGVVREHRGSAAGFACSAVAPLAQSSASASHSSSRDSLRAADR